MPPPRLVTVAPSRATLDLGSPTPMETPMELHRMRFGSGGEIPGTDAPGSVSRHATVTPILWHALSEPDFAPKYTQGTALARRPCAVLCTASQ